MKLNEMKIGQQAKILSVDINSTSAQRLIEIGFSEGTDVVALIKSMNSHLTAYKVKNTIIALRNETAEGINVSLV